MASRASPRKLRYGLSRTVTGVLLDGLQVSSREDCTHRRNSSTVRCTSVAAGETRTAPEPYGVVRATSRRRSRGARHGRQRMSETTQAADGRTFDPPQELAAQA